MHRVAPLAVDAAELEARTVVAPGQQMLETEVQARLVQAGLDPDFAIGPDDLAELDRAIVDRASAWVSASDPARPRAPCVSTPT